MAVTDSGMVKLFNELHPLKQFFAMAVTDSEIIKDVNELHP